MNLNQFEGVNRDLLSVQGHPYYHPARQIWGLYDKSLSTFDSVDLEEPLVETRFWNLNMVY